MGGHNNFFGGDFFGGGFFGPTDLAGHAGGKRLRRLRPEEEERLEDILDRLKAKVRKKKTNAQVQQAVQETRDTVAEQPATVLTLTLLDGLDEILSERAGRMETLKAIERMQDLLDDEEAVALLLLM